MPFPKSITQLINALDRAQGTEGEVPALLRVLKVINAYSKRQCQASTTAHARCLRPATFYDSQGPNLCEKHMREYLSLKDKANG